MDPDDDDELAALRALAAKIRLGDEQKALDAAASDPLVLDIVDRAVAHQVGKLPPEEIEEARSVLLAFFATDPRAERLLDELRSAGGKSHVVATQDAKDPPAAKPRAGRGPGRR
jgi:hypothetical protein